MRTLVLWFLTVLAADLMAKEVTFTLAGVDSLMSRIASHAETFPPQFSSMEERKATESELRQVLVVLDTAVARDKSDTALLYRDAFANMMGHNLDFEGCAEKAFKAFERFIELKPNDKNGYFFYGRFLASTAVRQKDSIKYLEKAVTFGVMDAHYFLGQVYIGQGDKTKALVHFKAYSKAYPEDEDAKKLIADMERPDFQIRRHEGPPPSLAK